MTEHENRYMYEDAVTVAEDRHPGVKDIAQYFNHRHLPPGTIRDTSAAVAELAQRMVDTLPDCPMLTRGLDNLLAAKDCFVRASLPGVKDAERKPKTPTIGQTVLYRVTADDANQINGLRAGALNHNAAGVTLASQELGAQIHAGNHVREDDIYPAVVVRVFQETWCNLHVLLDGNDTHWATSRGEGDGPGRWCWPARRG